MSKKPLIKADLIAPCGMNCALCMAYLRSRNRCGGCRGEDAGKPASCAACVIKNCKTLAGTGSKFCSPGCVRYPCRRLRDLDKRYRTKYHMSMLENLEEIGETGIRAFVRSERERWACPDCGGTICVHSGKCSGCGREAF